MHPDKHAGKPAEEQKKIEENFKLLGQALEILSDPMKRQLYDEGYDKEAIDERVQAAQRVRRRIHCVSITPPPPPRLSTPPCTLISFQTMMGSTMVSRNCAHSDIAVVRCIQLLVDVFFDRSYVTI